MCTIEHLETLRESRDREYAAVVNYGHRIADLIATGYDQSHPRLRSLYVGQVQALHRMDKHQHAIDLQLLEATK